MKNKLQQLSFHHSTSLLSLISSCTVEKKTAELAYLARLPSCHRKRYIFLNLTSKRKKMLNIMFLFSKRIYRVIGLKLIHFRLTIFSWLKDILVKSQSWDREIWHKTFIFLRESKGQPDAALKQAFWKIIKKISSMPFERIRCKSFSTFATACWCPILS